MGDLVLTDPSTGCSSECFTKPHYINEFSNMICSDQAPHSTLFTGYIRGLNLIVNSWGASAAYLNELVVNLQAFGCSVLPSFRPWMGDLCRNTNGVRFKSMAYLCPETCRCANLTTETKRAL